MYKILTLFSGLLLLSGCEKPDITEQETNDQTTEGNLTVSVYQIEHTPFSAFTRTKISEVCTRLNFAIYDADGTRVKQTNQTSDKTDFGHATFQLEEGTYQLVVVANSASGNPTMTNPAKVQFTNAQGYSDTFLYSEEVTITSEKQDILASLNRIVSLCRLVFTDDVPAEVKKIQFTYTGGSGAFNAYTGLGCVKSTQTVTYNVTEDNNQFDLYTFLHDTEGTIQLKVTALDASEKVLSERDFSVPMIKNKITWLSGAFFNGSDSQENTISIDINTEWDGEIHITF